MSAEVLREAARLMRERAEASAPGPWTLEAGGGDFRDVRDATGHWIAEASRYRSAEHIASWHPAVALAVADWLDFSADNAPPDPHEPGETNALGLPCADCARFYRARVVAVAYLGGDA